MKVIERRTEQNLSGSGMVDIHFTRVIEVPDGKLSEGHEKAPEDAPPHDWQKEEN